jgi:excisionase family DNA binding protein
VLRCSRAAIDDAPDVLNVGEAAALLQISRNSAYELVRSRLLHSVRIGRRIVVPKTALLFFLKERDEGRSDLRDDVA